MSEPQTILSDKAMDLDGRSRMTSDHKENVTFGRMSMDFRLEHGILAPMCDKNNVILWNGNT